MQAAPSQAELLFKNYKIIKEKLKSQNKDAIMEKYGNAASEEALPRELILGQSEREVEYDRTGRIIKGQVCCLQLIIAIFHIYKLSFFLNYIDLIFYSF